MSTSVTLVDTDEVAHEVIASLRRRNRDRDNVTEERLLAAIDTFVPTTAVSNIIHGADDSDEEGGRHLKTGWSSDEDDDRKSAAPSKKGPPIHTSSLRKGAAAANDDDDDDLLLGDDDDDFFRGFTAPVNSSKAAKSTTGRGALRGIQDLSAGSGSHSRSIGSGSAAGLGLNSAMIKPGQTIRVKAGGHVGKSVNNGVPANRK